METKGDARGGGGGARAVALYVITADRCALRLCFSADAGGRSVRARANSPTRQRRARRGASSVATVAR